MELDETRLEAFLKSLRFESDEALERVRKAAAAGGVPIIREETASLLTFLIKAFRPEKVLEAGCAWGYSSLVMSRAMNGRGNITTIEIDADSARRARENFAMAGAENIELVEGDAGEVMKRFEGESFDMIFMDAAKGQYLLWLDTVKDILKPGGILVSDNVFFDGDILLPRACIARRDRTIHTRMREYLYVLKNTPGLTTAIMNAGDGMALTYKELR